jgi:sulfoxide reductase heme-binding subunit YedZ
MNDQGFNKILISTNALLPLGLLACDFYRGALGANPLEFFLRASGVLTLLFVVVTLSVTPLRKIFGWNGLIKYRRMLGLYAFFYGCVHLITYSIFDKSLEMQEIVRDVIQRPFIAVGMAALLLMVPLAATSTNGMIKRLGGKNWSKLHKLTYAVPVLGVIHFWMIVKSDVFYPALFAVAVALVLGYRLFSRSRSKIDAVKKPEPLQG